MVHAWARVQSVLYELRPAEAKEFMQVSEGNLRANAPQTSGRFSMNVQYRIRRSQIFT